jgi:hypothetical protein
LETFSKVPNFGKVNLKNQKTNDNPKQNTFGKPHAACSNKLFADTALRQPVKTHDRASLLLSESSD